jgi:probable phosphoglycerate mutase
MAVKIAQYRCSLAGDSFLQTLGAEIEIISELTSGRTYEHEVLVWNNDEIFDEDTLRFFPSLKILVNWGTDVDNVNEAMLAQNGIIFKKVDFYATETLAEYILSIILLFERKHPQLIAGKKVSGNEIYGKKVGIIGLGKIGFRTAAMLHAAFSCEIAYFATKDKHLPGYTFATPATLFSTCDYVIITTKSSNFSIDVASLKDINPNLVVVNIARDSVLPLQGLLPLINSGHIRGFVGDLTVDQAMPVVSQERVLLLPHRGYLTQESHDLKRAILSLYLSKALGTTSPIYVVRHGETEWNKQGVMQGRKDSPLSADGLRHAQDTAAYFKEIPVKKVYTSPLGRAQKTAEIIASHIGAELVVVPDFAEMNFGIFEGKSKAILEEIFVEFFTERSRSDLYKLYIPYPGGESYYDVYLRVLGPFLELLRKQEPCIIVGHESVNRILRGLATEKSLPAMVHARQKNNEIVCIDLVFNEETVTSL